MTNLPSLLYLVTLCATFPRPTSGSPQMVWTNYGTMIGTSVNVLDTYITAFLGIPYAQPPVGHLRFRKPLPPDIPPVFEAKHVRDPCPQFGSDTVVMGSEDCLYLNIYVPPKTHEKPAVFVWIYGYGSFSRGDSQSYDAELLAVRGGVLVVTFDYRLGVLGFLSSGDDLLPGNLGLADQQMAIKWVKENIAAFGGDASRITICGISSGAASIGFHMLNPNSKSLFHRAIMQSGGATSSWTINRHPMRTFLDLALRIDCFNRNVTNINETNTTNGTDETSRSWTVDIVRCLRTRTANELIEADLNILKDSGPINAAIDKIWVPVIDHDLVAGDPTFLLSNATFLLNSGFYEYDLLTGVTENEGEVFYYNLMPALMSRMRSPFHSNGSRVEREFFEDEVVPSLVNQRFGDAPFITKEAIILRYENIDLRKSTRDENVVVSLGPMLRAYEDPAFVAPVVEQSRRHTSHMAHTFMYLQGHVTRLRDEEGGLSHGADAPYLFALGPKVTQGVPSHLFSDSDRNMSDIVIKYWTNFAKSG